uniref:Uncharacterized protein n=1 Tax=Cucumis melo TaxID=3656 RepID=A0A9I9EFN5_CUCME
MKQFRTAFDLSFESCRCSISVGPLSSLEILTINLQSDGPHSPLPLYLLPELKCFPINGVYKLKETLDLTSLFNASSFSFSSFFFISPFSHLQVSDKHPSQICPIPAAISVGRGENGFESLASDDTGADCNGVFCEWG